VTGHRALSDANRLGELIDQVLEAEIPKLLRPADSGSTTGLLPPQRLSVVSALAEGADRLVVRRVLQRDGSILQAALPLSTDDYLEDFHTKESKDDFLELLDLCRAPVFLRRRRLSSEFRAEEAADARRVAYRNAGWTVVDRCDILIALWDGQPANGKGGTADVVKYAKECKRPTIRIWVTETGDVVEVDPGCGIESRAMKEIQEFNDFPVDRERQTVKFGDLEKQYRVSSGQQDQTLRDNIRAVLIPAYARASAMAKHKQAKHFRSGTVGYSLSAAAVASVAVGVLAGPLIAWLSPVAFGVEMAILIWLWILVDQAHRKHHAAKWVESRFLAERLRGAICMAASGVEISQMHIPSYLGEGETPNDWTFRVFDEIWIKMPRMPGSANLSPGIAMQWLDEQIGFHRGKVIREGAKNDALHGWFVTLVVSTMFAAACHIAFHWCPIAGEAREWTERILTLIAIAAPAAAGALGGLRAHREHLRLKQRSQHMVPRLSSLKRRMSVAEAPWEFEIVLRETELAMLEEAQDWLALMRVVTIDPA